MSNDSSATVSSILVMLGNVQHENFHQMREMMVKFFEKVKLIETHLEDIERKLSNSSNVSITASSSVQSSSSSESRKFSPLRNQFLMSSPKSSDEEDPQEVPKTPGKNLDLASLGFAGTSSPPPTTQHHTEIFCFDCNRTFVRGSGEFSRHVRETSCKPYQCHCGKLFKKKSSLTAHESTHSTAVVACDCGAIFRCEQYLRNHKRRKHHNGSNDNINPITEPIAKVPRMSSTSEPGQVLHRSLPNPMDLLKLNLQD